MVIIWLSNTKGPLNERPFLSGKSLILFVVPKAGLEPARA